MADTAIWWIRRDLRLDDNPALAAAAAHKTVIPVFVLDPKLLQSDYVGEKRAGFLLANLRTLADELAGIGSRLIIRRGQPAGVVPTVAQETGAAGVYAERDHSPYARGRDQAVGERIALQLVGTPAIKPPGSVMKQDGDPYVVFSPFRDRWRAGSNLQRQDLPEAPSALNTPTSIASTPLPEEPHHAQHELFPPGSEAARARFHDFIADDDGLYDYEQRRDRIDLAGTSRLSPYFRFGLLSPRRAFLTAQERLHGADERAQEGVRTWLDELIWRDFYIHILHHFPRVRSQSFRKPYRNLVWENEPSDFKAWQAGETGYPIVDAPMRQLQAQGWMHNRARMIVASFLTKHLLIDWRWGEAHFMRHLLDGDPAANNGGWQWSAGTGTDAAPYFRIFNPILQSQRHDPNGAFIRSWLPELAQVPQEYIHEPWRMPSDVQRQAGCRVGKDYPAPIVDHAAARARALERYGDARED